MSKELIINQTFKECRVALVESSEVLDFLIDREMSEHRPTIGNIYVGKVLRVLPGMQSAFVDIGFERAAFLYVHDAYIPTLKEQREMAKELAQLEENAITQRELESGGKVIPDEFSSLSETSDLRYKKDVRIQDFLKEGDEIVVQIAKEPISTKGPRITRHITLPGRRIVYMPFMEHIGVSRRIEDETQRDRLKEILESITPEGKGVIARTVAAGESHKSLKSEFQFLTKVWKDIQKKIDTVKAPTEIYQDLNFIQRALRDITDDDVDTIIVDDRETYKIVEKFVDKYLPKMKGRIEFYEETTPLFEKYGLDIEIERALSNKVFLKSGGSINVDQTEALLSIDVNTGKFVGKKNLEETILKTNLEAAKEIAYQLRLRNSGGIIIIDFIDMERQENRNQLFEAFLSHLKKDRAKTNVLPISGLGLVEMTRKRTRDTLIRIMCDICPYCEGTGEVKSVDTVSYEILREVMKVIKREERRQISIFAHPEVCNELTSEGFNILESLEEKYVKQIVVRADNSYHVEQYEIFSDD